MTQYLNPSFSVNVGGKAYADGWDAIFGCRSTTTSGLLEDIVYCQLKRGHEGPCRCGEIEWNGEEGR